MHTYRAKPPPATPDILKCVLELLLALSDSPDLRQMHAKVGNPAVPTCLADAIRVSAQLWKSSSLLRLKCPLPCCG